MIEKLNPIKCENCDDGLMYAYAQDTQYYYFKCEKCKKERLIPKDEIEEEAIKK